MSFSPSFSISKERQFSFSKKDDNKDVKKDIEAMGLDSNPERQTWSNSLEFLMSCISMSVGLGNIWRFPFKAYDNGGGAFLIPYIIVLILVGKPLYYMEMVLGQFSSKGFVKFYDFSPAMRGAGVGITFCVMCVMTYYGSIMSLIFYYLFASFSPKLPWTTCDPSWPDECYPSGNFTNNSLAKSSSELYYKRTVLREYDDINDGIGAPSWELSMCLLLAWLLVFLILWKGIRSSGKAAYFLAIFPYVTMLVILIRALTLPGALNGIWFFIEPRFEKLKEPGVWYEAVIQCFFSLNVCFGNVIMYASYNKFRHNIYRDAVVITSLDTFTSMLAGCTIFGILGNLAHESDIDIKNVTSSGNGLAFISYPEAISRFQSVPQLFSILFFFMLCVLGIGSNVAIASSLITVIRDKYQKVLHWQAVLAVVLFGFFFGLIYITPGGQFVLNLVDYNAVSFVVFFLGIAQIIAITWIYGMRRFCDDIEFMLDRKVGIYWRICWPIVTPLILAVILIYKFTTIESLTYKDTEYPTSILTFGWFLTAFGLLQFPLFACLAFYKRRSLGFKQMVLTAFKPRESWGPTDVKEKNDWIAFNEKKTIEREQQKEKPTCRRIYDYVLGY